MRDSPIRGRSARRPIQRPICRHTTPNVSKLAQKCGGSRVELEWNIVSTAAPRKRCVEAAVPVDGEGVQHVVSDGVARPRGRKGAIVARHGN